jgi:translocation and assembly module TamB
VQRVQADVIEQRLRIKLDATHQADAIRVDAAQLNAGKGELRFKDKLDLIGQRAFQAVGKLQGFNPAEFGAYPAASLNADFNGEGRLADPLSVRLRFTLANSQLRGYPLSGAGEVELLGDHLTKADVTADLAGNHLNVQGAFGRPGDELMWSVDASELARLDPSLAGTVRGRGHLRGTASDPAVAFDLSAQDLRLPGDYSVSSLSSSGDVSSGANGTLNVVLNAQGLRSGNLTLASADGKVTGTRRQHTVQLRAVQP